ncbi:MAG: cohesin domain-containing protein [Minisyncoccia bacterium]
MKIFIYTISCVTILFLPTAVSAATVSIRATPINIGVSDVVRVDVILNSAVPANAFSGTLSYSKTLLEPVAVSDGNSIISMWITRPAISTSSAPMTFAGITPGGFSGTDGMLFSVLFRAKAVGSTKVSLGEIEVLRNDGVGGNEPTTTKPITISIGLKSSGGYVEPSDTTQPESFSAVIGTDTQLFGGKNYLVFTAVDKGSGIDNYVVSESRIPSFMLPLFSLSWRVTASPYVVANQDLTSTIYIKAVDRSGNERLSVFPPQHLFTVYEKVVLIAILILFVLLSQRQWGRRFE